MRTQPIKDIIRAEGALAHLFERYGIDYCCHGSETLETACVKKGLDVDLVLQEIEALKQSRPYSFLHGDLWGEEFLIEYIVENHHRYSRAMIPLLLEQLAHVNESHGDRFPYLKPVMFLFQRAAHEFEQHMRKEEMILFPYFKSLASAHEFSGRRPLAPFVTVDGPIARMEQEHEETAQIFAKIRALLGNFTVPNGACAMHGRSRQRFGSPLRMTFTSMCILRTICSFHVLAYLKKPLITNGPINPATQISCIIFLRLLNLNLLWRSIGCSGKIAHRCTKLFFLPKCPLEHQTPLPRRDEGLGTGADDTIRLRRNKSNAGIISGAIAVTIIERHENFDWMVFGSGTY